MIDRPSSKWGQDNEFIYLTVYNINKNDLSITDNSLCIKNNKYDFVMNLSYDINLDNYSISNNNGSLFIKLQKKEYNIWTHLLKNKNNSDKLWLKTDWDFYFDDEPDIQDQESNLEQSDFFNNYKSIHDMDDEDDNDNDNDNDNEEEEENENENENEI